MLLKVVYNKTTPLCSLSSGKMIGYAGGKLLLYKDGNVERECQISTSRKEKLLGQCNILTRSLRLGIRVAVALDDKTVLVAIGNAIKEFDLETKTISDGAVLSSRPLYLTNVQGVSGFQDGVYFGSYVTGNNDKNSVEIYRRDGQDKWSIVYTFPKGAINHVHNIIADTYRNCLWILTGDFDESAAIWKVEDNFRKIEKIVGGNQKYRGCVAFPTENGLLYATDAPFAKNYVYILNTNGEVEQISPLSGSCIYGCQWKDKYVLSTTVEPDGRNESLLKLLFSRKLGAGIEDRYARIYVGDEKEGFREIYKEKKDNWPFLFQFGTFKFPSGINTTDYLYFQPVATKNHDLDLMAIKEEL